MAHNAFNFKPRPFTGTSEDIDDWLDAFGRYADFANWDANKRYNALKSQLQEGAARWLRRQDLDELNSFDLLKEALATQYGLQPAQLFKLRQHLISRKQKSSESVADYAEDVGNMCFKLGIEEDHMHYFIQGLKQTIKKQVLRSQPTNLQAAITIAEAEEAAQHVDDDETTKVEKQAADLAHRVAELLTVNLSTQGNAQVAKIDTKMHNTVPVCQMCQTEGHEAPNCPRYGVRVQCQLCSRLGHSAPSCPTLQSSSTRGRQQPQRRTRDKSQIQCYSCGAWGHYSRECRRPPPASQYTDQSQGNAWGPTQPQSSQHHN